MTALDQQLGVVDESTYGTAVTVTRFFELEAGSDIKPQFGRTRSDPLRPGQYFPRSDRVAVYSNGATGTLNMAMLAKGFGWWAKHLLGATATTGPTDSVYTHTGTCGPLEGDFFTAQITKPLHPGGTAQAFTCSGGKVTKWTLSNSVDQHLMLGVDVDFQKVVTGTATASASYPSGNEPLSWTGGAVTIAGNAYPVSEFSLECTNVIDTERKRIQGSALKKEPTGEAREGAFSFAGDFDALTLYNIAAAATASGAHAKIVGTWTSPTLVGAAAYAQVIVTVEVAQFDEVDIVNQARGVGVLQTLSGAVSFDGTNSGIKLEIKNADSTA